MKTRSIEIFRRFWAADSERYSVKIRLLCSQEELENIKKRLFEEGN